MEVFNFAEGSKNFEECSSSEKYYVISLLKEELNLLAKITWFKINFFRNQDQIFAIRVVYKW